ncbi:MAG TPA: CoA transferase [Alphaproteobacteria bacterium]|jgi:crotonobetainyl-CoA:carnitine CoA-transferase CaiB-like acyl-CoA transferase|nr:CoA transferase [Alphaproteobacteria bacterium]
MAERPPPLRGVTVIDLTQIYNGPYATFMMAQAGAHVIKIEPPGGEHLRRRGVVGGAALPFAMLNSNKRAVTLNLKTARGRDLLIDMVRRADMLVENFAPGTMDRLGVGWDVLSAANPRLVYGSSSGYGLSGPNRDYPAMDLTVQAMSGIMSITGFPDRPPVKAGPAIVDFSAGIHLYGALMTALYEREKTGIGRLVEVSMQEAVYATLSSSLGMMFGDGNAPGRTGNRHSGLAESPYNVYPTRDGFIAIICVGEAHWRSLLGAMGREDLLADPRFATLKTRVAHMDLVDEIVAGWTAGFEKQPLFDLLIARHVPCAPVRDLAEVVDDPHMHARGALVRMDHPELGAITVPRSPLRFAGSALTELEPSGVLGAENDSVYGGWLGLSPVELDELRREGVI